ncbi:Plasma membrane t-SNARE, secretory vesicle fusion [Dinochytrium kinnereticum]|nr:Plasma membrane t-SNARE, secretory vesicle fusion [Dinochytrium kinnereticum]
MSARDRMAELRGNDGGGGGGGGSRYPPASGGYDDRFGGRQNNGGYDRNGGRGDYSTRQGDYGGDDRRGRGYNDSRGGGGSGGYGGGRGGGNGGGYDRNGDDRSYNQRPPRDGYGGDGGYDSRSGRGGDERPRGGGRDRSVAPGPRDPYGGPNGRPDRDDGYGRSGGGGYSRVGPTPPESAMTNNAYRPREAPGGRSEGPKSPTSPTTPFGKGPKGNTMEAFFEEVESVQRGVDRCDKNIHRIRQLQARALNASSSGESQRFNAELDEVNEATSTLLQTLRARVKAMSNATKQLPKSAEAHSRRGQQATLANKLMDVARSYQQCQADFKAKSKQRIEREIKIARPDATPAEIERAIEGGGGFAQQLLSSRVTDQRRLLNDVQKRHEEMRRIEQSLEELLSLFQEMEAMIDTQQEMINTIEAQAETAVINLEEGSKEMSKAITYRKNTRKKMWWVIVIIIIVLLVAAFLTWFFVFRGKTGSEKN